MLQLLFEHYSGVVKIENIKIFETSDLWVKNSLQPSQNSTE